IYSVTDVTGFGGHTSAVREFLPFFAASERHRRDNPAYYTLQRQPRLQSSQREVRKARSTYSGSEVCVALVDGDEGPYASDVQQLGVMTLCTNRDLPLLMSVGSGKTDFTLEAAPVDAIRCIAGPTEPRESPAWGEKS